MCHVHETRELNKTSTSPLNLTLHGPLAQLTTVLSHEMKCTIILFMSYTPSVVKTYKELYVSQVLGLSQVCRMPGGGGGVLDTCLGTGMPLRV